MFRVRDIELLVLQGQQKRQTAPQLCVMGLGFYQQHEKQTLDQRCVRGGDVVQPPFGHFFFHWLGVTRASDPPVTRGHRLSFFLSFFLSFVLCQNTLEILPRKGGWLAAPHQKKIVKKRVFASEVLVHRSQWPKHDIAQPRP